MCRSILQLLLLLLLDKLLMLSVVVVAPPALQDGACCTMRIARVCCRACVAVGEAADTWRQPVWGGARCITGVLSG